MNKNIFKELEKNKNYLDNYFNSSADYFYKPIKIYNQDAAVVMCEALVNSQRLWQVYLNPLNDLEGDKTPQEVFDYIYNQTTIPVNPSTVEDFNMLTFFLTAGFAVLLIDNVDKALVMPSQGIPLRGVDQPTAEGNLRGSKESFTDSSRLNMALIRRRIRGENLSIETMQLGSKTKTEVCLYYNTDFCPQELISDIQNKLKNIDLPMIFETGYISPFIDDTKYSVFQATGYTERPDTFCAKICEGKVGIMVDGSPYALIYPYFFHENFVTNDDYSQRPYFASFIRVIRYISFLIAVILPSLYVSITIYAPQTLPRDLLFFIYSSKNSTPLPLFLEAIVIVILLEIIKEAGLRLPQPIGHTVSFVSALIIGDAAITAGLIGSAVLIVCAFSVISSFVVPSFYEAIIIMRILLLIFSGVFGIIGFSVGISLLVFNIINVNACSFNYLSIFDNSKLFKDSIFRSSWRNKKGTFDLKKVKNEN